jgi:hypothetical protein
MKHIKSYRAAPNGGQTVCSCGWASPTVDESSAFTLGRKVKSPDDYFSDHLREHLALVETTMEAPVREQAVAPAQRPQARKSKKLL